MADGRWPISDNPAVVPHLPSGILPSFSKDAEHVFDRASIAGVKDTNHIA